MQSLQTNSALSEVFNIEISPNSKQTVSGGKQDVLSNFACLVVYESVLFSELIQTNLLNLYGIDVLIFGILNSFESKHSSHFCVMRLAVFHSARNGCSQQPLNISALLFWQREYSDVKYQKIVYGVNKNNCTMAAATLVSAKLRDKLATVSVPHMPIFLCQFGQLFCLARPYFAEFTHLCSNMRLLLHLPGLF